MKSTPGRGLFVTGTDTGVGKTLVAAAILLAAGRAGFSTAGFKPVAAGCEQRATGWVNEDALLLQAASSVPLAYQEVNPLALPQPVAPHIAAAALGLAIELPPLLAVARQAFSRGASLQVVEGAGGWLVPLSAETTMADLAAGLGYPVVLVVGLRLGCLNHALLSTAAIAASGLPLAGWVGSMLSAEMPVAEENIATLRERIAAPCLGVIPWLGPAASPQQAVGHLALAALLNDLHA